MYYKNLSDKKDIKVEANYNMNSWTNNGAPGVAESLDNKLQLFLYKIVYHECQYLLGFFFFFGKLYLLYTLQIICVYWIKNVHIHFLLIHNKYLKIKIKEFNYYMYRHFNNTRIIPIYYLLNTRIISTRLLNNFFTSF